MLDGENNIVKDAIRGKASAFGLLYDYYQPKIYRFVLIKVGQREEAEDLTHQVFLSAWQNISSYESRGFPFSSWLYRIARNQITDHYRMSKPITPIEQINPDYFAEPASAAIGFDQAINLNRIRLAINQLEPNYQDVIIMRFIEDLTLKETAAALQRTEGSVKVAQHRALKKLKEILGENN